MRAWSGSIRRGTVPYEASGFPRWEYTCGRVIPGRPNTCARLPAWQAAPRRIRRVARIMVRRRTAVRSMDSSVNVHPAGAGPRIRPNTLVTGQLPANKKRSSSPASHKTDCRPLLPSGPGGVGQSLVAQDLTSQWNNEYPSCIMKHRSGGSTVPAPRGDFIGENATAPVIHLPPACAMPALRRAGRKRDFCRKPKNRLNRRTDTRLPAQESAGDAQSMETFGCDIFSSWSPSGLSPLEKPARRSA